MTPANTKRYNYGGQHCSNLCYLTNIFELLRGYKQHYLPPQIWEGTVPRCLPKSPPLYLLITVPVYYTGHVDRCVPVCVWIDAHVEVVRPATRWRLWNCPPCFVTIGILCTTHALDKGVRLDKAGRMLYSLNQCMQSIG